jgi:hypothetical protein
LFLKRLLIRKFTLMNLRFFCFLFGYLLICMSSSAQQLVNAYASVSAINGTILSVYMVDEQFDSFEAGEKIMVIQMQGASVTDTSNSAAFGILDSLFAAGRYEFAQIVQVNEVSGVPVSIQLTVPLHWNFYVSGTVQVVSFPVLGGGNSFTTNSSLTCKSFDGKTGGVLCFEVNGNLNLQHSLSVSGKGFRGGNKSLLNGNGDCDPSLFAVMHDSLSAMKGEGVYIPQIHKDAGRARSVNGGGGGVVHNGGGGGGSNYTDGGNGGPGFIHQCPNSDGFGFGGHDLQWHIFPDRIFMGGGGGGGHDNNSYGTAGANGGGIMILKCDTLMAQVNGNELSIEANGADASSDANDGKGGGGAGGSIVLDAVLVKSSGVNQLQISANGGKGGDVTVSKQHAGGGGGGQGVVMLLCGGSEENVIFETLNGKGGRNMSSFSSTSAGDGQGADNSGVFIDIPSDTLIATLQTLYAVQDSFSVAVNWISTYEKNISTYDVLRSDGTSGWQWIGAVAGKGPGIFNGNFNYQFKDMNPQEGVNYYRLRMQDTLGCIYLSPVCAVEFNNPDYAEDVLIYPNPSVSDFIIRSNFDFSPSYFRIWDVRGREVSVQFEMVDSKQFQCNAQHLEDGIYLLQCVTNNKKKIIRLMVMD